MTIKHKPGDVTIELARLLKVEVIQGFALVADNTFVEVYTRDERGFPDELPDFEHDLDAIVRHLPPGVEMRLRYSQHFEAWVCLLMRGAELYEGMGDTEALAAARAFRQLLAFNAAAAKQAEKAGTS